MILKEMDVRHTMVPNNPYVKWEEPNKVQNVPIQVLSIPPPITKFVEPGPPLIPIFDIKHKWSKIKIPIFLSNVLNTLVIINKYHPT